jgi:ATP-dependent Zn protease
MDKESLELVKEAYEQAKEILTLKRSSLIYFSELLQNNTILYEKDVKEFY